MSSHSDVVSYCGYSHEGPSDIIWRKLDLNSIRENFGFGVLVEDDFHGFGLTTAVASNVGRYASRAGVWKSFEDTGAVISQIKHVDGVIRLETDSTDNDEVSLQLGGDGTGTSFVISDTAGDDRILGLEFRFRVGQVGNTYNIFLGLAEEGSAATNFIADDGTLASKDLIGFKVNEDDGTGLDIVYRKAGQALQTVKESALTLAASTFYKVGLLYNPAEEPAKRIRFWANSVANDVGSYVTATNIAATTFPDAETLNLIFALQSASAAAKNLDIDYVRVAQHR